MAQLFRKRWFSFCVIFLAFSLLLPGCSNRELRPSVKQSPPVEPSPPEPTSALLEATDKSSGMATDAPEKNLVATLTLEPSPEQVRASLMEDSAARFITNTSEGANQVIARLGEMSPHSADGPLAAAILREAGIIQSGIEPRAFWLLNPRNDIRRIESYLPHEDFLWTYYSVPARQINFSASLVQPGDLIYLIPPDEKLIGSYYAATRIDSAGRGYTVTILPGQGSETYQIREELLFDPSEPELGLLRITSLASTGRGMLVWHKRTYTDQSEYEKQLNRVLDRGGKWSVLVREIGGETLFMRHAVEIVHPASIIKVPLGMLVLHSLTINHQDLEVELANAPPQAGRTYGQLIYAMLALSEETATDILERDLFERMGASWIRSTLDSWGAEHTTFEPRRTTVEDIEQLFLGLYTKRFLNESAGQLMLDSLSEVTGGDTVRLWKLKPLLPPGAVIYNKRGSLTNPMVVADAGILSMPEGNAYFISLVGIPDEWTTFEELDQIIGDFVLTWYQLQIIEGLGP